MAAARSSLRSASRSLDPMDGVATLAEKKLGTMLPPFIIEQIRKRESEERTHQEQPRLELPLEPMRPPTMPSPPQNEDDKRGVIIVEL